VTGVQAHLRHALLAPLVVALGLLQSGSVPGAASAQAKPVTHTVTIDATSYSPKTLTVRVGDTIVWVNEDLFPHTVTAKTGRFDSGDIAAGESWTYTVKAEGMFGYFCIYHTTMKGTLRIR